MPVAQSPDHLRCNYLVNPLGIHDSAPVLSWELRDDRRGACQSAYQIVAASNMDRLSDKPDLWDSGKVASDQSIGVPYRGPALASRQRAYWTVRTWDHAGQPSPWSGPAFWEMGLLNRTDWSARWLQVPIYGGRHTTAQVPFLRRAVALTKPIRSARLYATALGLYEFHINGQRVGNDCFTPGWMEYRQRTQYQVYDVTALLKTGENALGSILGDGWYCGHVGGDPRQMYSDRPRLLAQLMVVFADGSTQTIATDASWKWSFGPILESDIMWGESYDARRELIGWSSPGYDDSTWLPVEIYPDPGISLDPMQGPPVRPIMEIKPVAPPLKFRKGWNRDGWIFDLGQNMVGHVRLKVKGPAGTTVVLRHAEMLDENQRLYVTNLRDARQTDSYTLKGDANGEVWEPRFTFHGFRYVEFDHPGNGGMEPPIDTITGIVCHSDIPPTGQFECSDPLINQLQHNIQWGQRGNYFDVPTDCPQRNERLGWLGDAQIFIRTGAFNFDIAGFYRKWLVNMMDSQGADGGLPPLCPAPSGPGGDGGPAWDDAVMICPWVLYLCYADKPVLARHYETCVCFMDFLMEKKVHNYIRGLPGFGYQGYGDWLAKDGSEGRMGGTPKDIIGTAFLAYSARLMSQIAEVLGKDEDAAKYRSIHDHARNAFINRYITPDGLMIGGTQTSYVLALHFDLLPSEHRAKVAQALVDDIKSRGMHLSTGFVGSPYILHALTSTGHLDVAYALLHQKTWPSWLYAVTQGATTIWERWDGWTHDNGFANPSMNSFNHYAYGSVGDWLYGTVAGLEIDPAQPAYKHILIRPHPGGGLSHAKAALRSMYGLIECGWRLDGSTLRMDLTIPPNTTAALAMPAGAADAVTESGRPARQAEGVRFVDYRDGRALYALSAGRYSFSATGVLPTAAPLPSTG